MKKIVWDLDDVLNRFTESWLKQAWQVEHPECRLAFDQLRSNPPLEELHVSLAEYLQSLDRFRLSAAAGKMPPHPAVLDWFERHGEKFRHHVLTARPVKTIGTAAAWVFDHFGKWIRDFHFVPSPRPNDSLPAYDTSKAEVLARLGTVDFFVDDSPQNVAAAAARGIRAFVFPQPWNRAEKTVPQILAAFSNDSGRNTPHPIRFCAKGPETQSATVSPEETGKADRVSRRPALYGTENKVHDDPGK